MYVGKITDWRSRNVNCPEDAVKYSVADAAYSEAKSGSEKQNARSRRRKQLSEVGCA